MATKRFPKPTKWTPKFPEKYIGNVNNIIARSSWEIKFLNYLDNNPSVLFYNSEEFVVNYFSPIDNKYHRYFVDFIAKMRLKDNSVKTYAIEIKPKCQMIPPVKNKNKEQFLNEMKTYIVNQAKWTAAKEFCNSKDIEFIVLNEDNLGIS